MTADRTFYIWATERLDAVECCPRAFGPPAAIESAYRSYLEAALYDPCAETQRYKYLHLEQAFAAIRSAHFPNDCRALFTHYANDVAGCTALVDALAEVRALVLL